MTPLTTLRLAEENVRVELAKVREQLKNTDAIALAGEQAKSELDAMTERRKVGGQRHYRDPADEVAAGLRMRVEAAAHVSALQGRLRAEEAYLLVELERTRRDVEARGVRQSLLPMLEHVGDAPLCPMRWDQMEGTGDARRCSRCKHEVYNIAMVEADQAEAPPRAPRQKPPETAHRRHARGRGLSSIDQRGGRRRHRLRARGRDGRRLPARVSLIIRRRAS